MTTVATSSKRVRPRRVSIDIAEAWAAFRAEDAVYSITKTYNCYAYGDLRELLAEFLDTKTPARIDYYKCLSYVDGMLVDLDTLPTLNEVLDDIEMAAESFWGGAI